MKHFRYLKYVLRHKWFVLLKCIDFGIGWRGIVHDISKFSPSEWFPYVDKFYGGPWEKYSDRHGDARNFPGYKYTQEWVDERFRTAWLHHQRRNPHHWQYWVLRNDDGTIVCLEIPRKCALEMVADWWGAGRAIKTHHDGGEYDELQEWYAKNRDKIMLHDNTREFVEEIVSGLYEMAYRWRGPADV